MGPWSNITGVLIRKQADTQGECQVKMECEIEAMDLQAKDHLGLLEAGRDKEGFYHRNQGKQGPVNTLIPDFYPPELQDNTCVLFYAT